MLMQCQFVVGFRLAEGGRQGDCTIAEVELALKKSI